MIHKCPFCLEELPDQVGGKIKDQAENRYYECVKCSYFTMIFAQDECVKEIVTFCTEDYSVSLSSKKDLTKKINNEHKTMSVANLKEDKLLFCLPANFKLDIENLSKKDLNRKIEKYLVLL